MIFQLCKWHFDIDWYKFEKRWANVFQIYPNSIHFNLLQSCPSMSFLGFPVFCWSSSIVLNSYFDILVNYMTIRSLKLAEIAWPSPFNIFSSLGLLPSDLVAQSVEEQWCNPRVVGSIPTLVRVFLCPCVGPFRLVGLTLTWFIWGRNLALHITL